MCKCAMCNVRILRSNGNVTRIRLTKLSDNPLPYRLSATKLSHSSLQSSTRFVRVTNTKNIKMIKYLKILVNWKQKTACSKTVLFSDRVFGCINGESLNTRRHHRRCSRSTHVCKPIGARQDPFSFLCASIFSANGTTRSRARSEFLLGAIR